VVPLVDVDTALSARWLQLSNLRQRWISRSTPAGDDRQPCRQEHTRLTVHSLDLRVHLVQLPHVPRVKVVQLDLQLLHKSVLLALKPRLRGTEEGGSREPKTKSANKPGAH
jgi:hypothetical protein